MKYSAIVKKGEKQYVALCPELDVVSQGYTRESALKNLKEAVELYLEDEPAPPTALEHNEVGDAKAAQAVRA